MRVLLLSPVPPSPAHTAGIVLEQLCKFIPKESLACCAVMDKAVHPKDISQHFKEIPFLLLCKPRERGIAPFSFMRLPVQFLSRFSIEWYAKYVATFKIKKRIIVFAKKLQISHLWVLLEGQTMCRLAIPVSRALGVPLYCQATDPVSWYLQAHNVDKWTIKEISSVYFENLKRSRVSAAPSEPMAELIQSLCNTKAILIGNAINYGSCFAPAISPTNNGIFRIGIAGQLYAQDAWLALLQTLENLEWKLNGQILSIRYLGRYFNQVTDRPIFLEYLGWHSHEETIRLMSQCDLLYCPYPFADSLSEVARLSFPSKLPGYFAAGRPVFIHAPKGSSIEKYARNRNVAYICTSLDPTTIANELKRVFSEPQLYHIYSQNACECLKNEFSLPAFRHNFAKFLELDLETLLIG